MWFYSTPRRVLSVFEQSRCTAELKYGICSGESARLRRVPLFVASRWRRRTSVRCPIPISPVITWHLWRTSRGPIRMRTNAMNDKNVVMMMTMIETSVLVYVRVSVEGRCGVLIWIDFMISLVFVCDKLGYNYWCIFSQLNDFFQKLSKGGFCCRSSSSSIAPAILSNESSVGTTWNFPILLSCSWPIEQGDRVEPITNFMI